LAGYGSRLEEYSNQVIQASHQAVPQLREARQPEIIGGCIASYEIFLPSTVAISHGVLLYLNQWLSV